MDWTRRRFLLSTAVIAGLAGCTEDTGSPSTDDSQDQNQDQTTQKNDQSTEGKPNTTEQSQTESQAQSDGYKIKIIAKGEWSGALTTGGSSKSIDGKGTKTFTIDGNPTVVSANAQKQGANSNKLTIQIIKDGEVVKEGSTTADHGMAQVSTSAMDSGNSDKKSPYTVKISYEDKWSGAVGSAGSTRSVEGSGSKTFDIKGDPTVISANAQKQDASSKTLTIQILEDGEVLKESTTDAEYGMATVSVTV